VRVTQRASTLGIVVLMALAGCSSNASTASTSSTPSAPPTAAAAGSAAAGSAAAGSTAASAQPAASSNASASAVPSGSAGAWMGDSLARAAMPKKEDIATVIGAAVPKDPDVSNYTSKDLKLSATVTPTSCTDAYALVWALTVPRDTKSFTGASYAIGNSNVVVSIADSPLTLEKAKATIDACPNFSVQRTADSSKYTVGDMLTQFAAKADLVSPDALAIQVGTSSQVLTDTSDTCVAGGTLAPSCIQNQSEQVSQILRRVGPNLISVWGITTTDVGGSAASDTPITLAEVDAIANGVQKTVTGLVSS